MLSIATTHASSSSSMRRYMPIRVPTTMPSPMEIRNAMITRLNVAARWRCIAPRSNSRRMNSHVATGPGMVWRPTTSLSSSQPRNRESRPASRNTGLASLLRNVLFRVVLSGKGVSVKVLNASDISTGDFNKLVYKQDQIIDHLLVPLFGDAGFPAGPNCGEQALVRQAVQLVVQDALPDSFVAVHLHHLDGFLHRSKEGGQRSGISTVTAQDDQDRQVIAEAHLGQQVRHQLDVAVLAGAFHAGNEVPVRDGGVDLTFIKQTLHQRSGGLHDLTFVLRIPAVLGNEVGTQDQHALVVEGGCSDGVTTQVSDGLNFAVCRNDDTTGRLAERPDGPDGNTGFAHVDGADEVVDDDVNFAGLQSQLSGGLGGVGVFHQVQVVLHVEAVVAHRVGNPGERATCLLSDLDGMRVLRQCGRTDSNGKCGGCQHCS